MKRPQGHTAVMADKAPGVVEGDSPLTRHYRRLEFFPTPPWAARAGGELVQALDPGPWTAEDPCCGQGHMAHALKDYHRTVATADIFDHGWDGQDRVRDFKAARRGDEVEPDWYYFNPPFTEAADFIRLGLQRARRGVAVLARQALMESAGRFDLFFGGETRLWVYAPFFERVPMVLGRWDPKASTATAYAWFLFRVNGADDPLAWPIVRPIRPGTRDRLTKPDDARLFATPAAAPLFETPPT